MGRMTDRRIDAAVERFAGDPLGLRPDCGNRRPRKRAVAGERELATGRQFRSLIDHPADRRRESRVVHSVEHHLGDSPLAFRPFRRRFVIDCLGQAFERALAAPIVRF